MVNEYRFQPAKGAFLLYMGLTTVFIRLPWWIISKAVPAFRTRSSWTFKKALFRELIHTAQDLSRYVDLALLRTATKDRHSFKESRALASSQTQNTPPQVRTLSYPGSTPSRTSSSRPIQEWMRISAVSAVRIPGYWIDNTANKATPASAPPLKSERVLYNFHGGGYVSMSAAPHDVTGNIVSGIMEQAPSITRAFSLEYRLSSAPPDEPANAFPAALLDAIAGYIYLVRDVGFAPEDIILGGDSSGGNLALALVRYLVENAGLEGLPTRPRGLLLESPWVDLSGSDVEQAVAEGLFEVDYMIIPGTAVRQYGFDAFLGPMIHEGSLSQYISPASVDPRAEPISFKGFPPTFVCAGGAESFAPSIRVLVERMKRDIGEDRTYVEAPDAVHDFLAFPIWEPERTDTLRAIGAWIEQL